MNSALAFGKNMTPSKQNNNTPMDIFIRFIISHEAGIDLARHPYTPNITLFEYARKTGYSDHPSDPGGPTMCGVTLRTYTAYCSSKSYTVPNSAALRAIPYAHWRDILRSNFWNPCHADEIRSPEIAYIIVDWVWASGPRIIKNIQRILGVTADGIIGPRTLAAINAAVPATLFRQIYTARNAYIDSIITANPALRTFRRGWLRRIDTLPSPS